MRARALAYCTFALEHPGRYRLMFSEPLPDEHPGEGPLPGAWVLDDLRSAVAPCGRGDGPSTEAATLLVWCGLHGIVTLRATKPLMAWPPVDGQVEDLLASVGLAAR